MKKFAKYVAVVAVTWTVSEWVTMWRMQSNDMTLAEFSRMNLGVQRNAFGDIYSRMVATSSPFATESPSDVLHDAFHKKYYPN